MFIVFYNFKSTYFSKQLLMLASVSTCNNSHTCIFNLLEKCFLLLLFILSLSHMKITASVTKSLHQDRCPCYLHSPIFFLYVHCPLLLENKKIFVITVFLSKLDHRPLFNIYFEIIVVWGLASLWLAITTTAFSIHHVSLNLINFNHYCFTKS